MRCSSARRWLFSDPLSFHKCLDRELQLLERRADRQGKTAYCRLNVASDLDWSRTVERFPRIRFYDYTKVRSRLRKAIDGQWPSNYLLTLSYNEKLDENTMRAALWAGLNVSVVSIPSTAHRPSESASYREASALSGYRRRHARPTTPGLRRPRPYHRPKVQGFAPFARASNRATGSWYRPVSAQRVAHDRRSRTTLGGISPRGLLSFTARCSAYATTMGAFVALHQVSSVCAARNRLRTALCTGKKAHVALKYSATRTHLTPARIGTPRVARACTRVRGCV